MTEYIYRSFVGTCINKYRFQHDEKIAREKSSNFEWLSIQF